MAEQIPDKDRARLEREWEEVKEYRDLLETPDKFDDGFTIRTIIGVLFISLIMTPGEMYLGLVTGGGIGAAAQIIDPVHLVEREIALIGCHAFGDELATIGDMLPALAPHLGGDDPQTFACVLRTFCLLIPCASVSGLFRARLQRAGEVVTQRTYRMAWVTTPSYAEDFGTENVTAVKFIQLNRANHIYILAAGLVNLMVGIYLEASRVRGRAWLQRLGSALMLVAPPVLGFAFFCEPDHVDRSRPITAVGLQGLFAGCLLHLPSLRRGQRDRAAVHRLDTRTSG